MTCRVYFTNIIHGMGNIPQLCRMVYGFVLAIAMTGTVHAAAPPVVDNFTATPPAVLPGESVVLRLDASDPDCPDVCSSGCGQYLRSDITSWSSTGGTLSSIDVGVSGSPYTTTALWQAPETEGTYTISVYLADSGGFMCGGRKNVTATLDVTVALVINDPPVIESVTANPTLLYPDESSQLACSATDPEGEDLTYSWDATSGTVTPTTAGSATFTGGNPGITTVTCTATDPAGASASDTVNISIIGAEAEKTLEPNLVTPQRVGVTSWGDLFVADRSAGGITSVNLFSGETVYRLPYPDVTSVAVTWNDDLLAAGSETATVVSRNGAVLMTLDPGELLGRISDVAVDPVNRRYGALYRKTGRVVVFDETGAVIGAFGSTGEAADQFMSPNGLAAAPDGTWLVGDTGNAQVKRFDIAGNLLGAFGARGTEVGEFMQIDDVAVDSDGVVYVSDSFQDWVVSFNSDGSPRESMGTYGDEVGQLKTASGVATARQFDRVIVASLNGSSLEVFKTTRNPVTVAPEPLPSLSNLALDFPVQLVGTVGGELIVTLTNEGDAPLGVRGAQIDADFRKTDDCPPYLDPGQFCDFSVAFAPTRPGAISGTLTIDTSATGEPVAVALTGIGSTPPAAVLSPASLAFGGVRIGNASAPRVVTLTNTGTETLIIGSIGITGEYTKTTSCGSNLAGGASCTVEVVFVPRNEGDPIVGELLVTTNAAGSPHIVPLSGIGLPGDASLSISDARVTEGEGQPTLATFTVTLSGTAPETVTVEYRSIPDTATEEDFTPVAGSLTFSEETTERSIVVVIEDDELLEPDEETFSIELFNPVNAAIQVSKGTGTILDDELCPSPNLVSNPNAEEPVAGSAIPGWNVVEGTWRMGVANPAPFEGAKYFAAGSSESGTCELAQTVDVSMFAGTIDAEVQRFAFEVYIRTAEPDVATTIVEYLDANGAVLGAFNPGEISSSSRWTRLADFHFAPPLTRQIRIRLIGRGTAGESTGAYFDHLALVSLRVPTIWVDELSVYEGDANETYEAEFAARLACSYFEEVRGTVSTTAGTAAEGEDYLAANVGIVFEPGEIEAPVPVTIIGDDVDEDHEDFKLELTIEAGAVVDPFGAATAIIYNDDFCAQTASFWAANPDLWPVGVLTIGEAEYDSATLLWLLSYSGSDVSHELAREVVAAKLNLAIGSDPSIVATVEAADEYLTLFPPGSHPTGQAKQEGRELVDLVKPYNDSGCLLTRRTGGRRMYCDACDE